MKKHVWWRNLAGLRCALAGSLALGMVANTNAQDGFVGTAQDPILFGQASHLDVTEGVQPVSLFADDKKDDKKDSYSVCGVEYEKVGPVEHKVEMKFGGRIHLDQIYFLEDDPLTNEIERGDPSLPPEDRWFARRVRYEVAAKIGDYMYAKIDHEIFNPQASEFRDMYIGWYLPDNGSLTLGNVKRPITLETLTSSRYLLFNERPAISQCFNDDERRVGLLYNGHTDDLLYTYAFGGFLLDLFQRDGEARGNAYQAQAIGRFTNNYWYDEQSGGRGWGYWGVSGAYSDATNDPDLNGDPKTRFRTRAEVRSLNSWLSTQRFDIAQYQTFGLEKAFNAGPLLLQGEAIFNPVQRNDGDDVFFWGYYAQAHYFLTGEHQAWDREDSKYNRVKPFENFFLVRTCPRPGCDGDAKLAYGLGAVGVGLRYSYIDLTDEDIVGGEGHHITAVCNWWLNPNARFNVDYIWSHLDDPAAGAFGTFGQAQTQTINARMQVDW